MSDALQMVPDERTAPPRYQLAQANTPMAMLASVIEQGADLEKMAKLMELSERWEANEARKAFTAAMAAFKANPPEIVKDKEVKFSTTKYRHATLGNVCSAIVAGLADHSISHRWTTDQTESGKITVTCILTHAQGHSESVHLSAGGDASGQKNAIQQIGSTITYLQRYTLLSATGLGVLETDDDGNAASPPNPKTEPGIIVVKPGTPWGTLIQGDWADVMSPLNDGKLSVHSRQGEEHMRELWKAHQEHPAMCAWGADWLSDKMDDTGLTWTDLRELDAAASKPLRLPEKMTQATGRELRAACAIIAGNTKAKEETK